jgi:hypothetical protein
MSGSERQRSHVFSHMSKIELNENISIIIYMCVYMCIQIYIHVYPEQISKSRTAGGD